MSLAEASAAHRTIVSLKAFGDLVIALDCLQRSPGRVRATTSILLGVHLLPLFEALDASVPCVVVNHSEGSLPALFTIKKDGLLKAFMSAWSLKAAIKIAGLAPDTQLIFDRLGPRERWVTSGWRQLQIGQTSNIYIDYDRFFADSDCAAVAPLPSKASGPLRIFPGSRVPAKNLPVTLVGEVMALFARHGSPAELMLLEGERLDLEQSGLPYTIVPRDFAAMVAAVRGAGRVVSADSMPAHIAEAVGCETFVFSPVANRYWLPRSTFLRQWDALFDEGCTSDNFRGFLDA